MDFLSQCFLLTDADELVDREATISAKKFAA
jgi:hypothetical protein